MIPRECDNDDCDYEAATSSDGRVYAKWVHVPECVPLPDMNSSERYPPVDYFQK